MTTAVSPAQPIAWWREPTRDQWQAFLAALFGWLLDAFDFTIFFYIIAPIAEEFKGDLAGFGGSPITWVALTITFTLWMRLVGAFGSGWLCDRIGRKTPLMLSILMYSICNFAAGFSPNFWWLATFRILLGIGMGAEWPAGAALAMETWPNRSRGLMSGLLQGAWGLGFLLATIVYSLLYDKIGWRGMLWLGILPALICVWIRSSVKESAVWEEENRNRQAGIAEAKAAGHEQGGFGAGSLFTLLAWIVGAVVITWVLAEGFRYFDSNYFNTARFIQKQVHGPLIWVVAAAFMVFVLPNLMRLLRVHVPEQMGIFTGRHFWNTFTASTWMTGQFLVYYSMIAMFPTWLQKGLKFTTQQVAWPNIWHNIVVFFAMGFWGYMGDRIGRRWAIIIPAVLGCVVAPFYLNTNNLDIITIGFAIQGAFAGAIYGLQPAYLTERFATESRGTASAFTYHFGTILGGIVPPAITYLAVDQQLGFATPMLYGTIAGAVVAVISLLLSPETKGIEMAGKR